MRVGSGGGGVGVGFHINTDGIIDELTKNENGSVIAVGLEIGMRLLAVDGVHVRDTSEVMGLIAKHEVGRAARFVSTV